MKRTLPILSIICLWFTACSTLVTGTPAPTAVVIIAPTLPLAPSSLAVKSFAASPNPVDRNAQLTLSWDVAGAASVTLWPMTYDRKLGRWFRIPAGAPGYPYSSPAASGSAKGQWTMRVPSDARYSLRFELEAADASGAKIVAATDVIDLTCYPSVTGSGYCPFPAQSVQGAYQPFEQGLLIWRGDTQQIYILSANQTYYIPWSLQSAINSTNSLPPPPTGLYAPADRFAGLWSSFRLIAGVLGTTPPEWRTLTVAEILG